METGRLALVMALLLPSACVFNHGPRPARLAELRPGGVAVAVQLDRRAGHAERELTGELLEVQDSAIVLLRSTDVVLVEFSAIRRLEPVRAALAPDVRSDRRPGSAGPALRSASRYPQGMPAVALRRLLEARQQTTLIRIARLPRTGGQP